MPYLDDLLKKAKEEGERQKKVRRDEDDRPAEEERKHLVDSYANVKIYRVQGDPMPLYEVPSPTYKGEEKALIDALIEIAANVIEPNKDWTDEEKRQQYYQRVLHIIENSPELHVPVNSREGFAAAVVREIAGYGLIDELVKDDDIEDILVIGPSRPIYVHHRKYEMMKTSLMFYDDKDIRNLIDRIARNINRRIDFQVPLLDARLPDGTRVNATIAPITLNGSTLSLRKFRKDPYTIIDLINSRTVSYELAAFLWLVVDGLGAYPANLLIAGGTGAGKTTLLNVLASFIPGDERILTIEDLAELNLPLPHLVRFEVRPAGLEGTGEINMNDLVKNSLRMRPDRILVGEIRGEEGFTMFAAMNTGHRGVMGTLHANSARETLVRLASPPINVPNIMLSALNFVVMEQRIHDRRKGTLRRVTEVAEVVSDEKGDVHITNIFEWDPLKDTQVMTQAPSMFLNQLTRFTSASKKELNEELKAREDVLRELNKKGIRSLGEVCGVTQGYVLNKKWSI